MLEIDPRTVTSSVKSGQLTRRVRDSLQQALQHGIGSASDRQRERSDKLEARFDKIERQVKELKDDLRGGLKGMNKLETRLGKAEDRLKDLKETLPVGLKRLRMSLDGVRKYYRVQRRLIVQRLSILEAGGEGTETGLAMPRASSLSSDDRERGTKSPARTPTPAPPLPRHRTEDRSGTAVQSAPCPK